MGRERERERVASERKMSGRQSSVPQTGSGSLRMAAPAVVFGHSAAAAAAKSKQSDSYDKLLQRVDL